MRRFKYPPAVPLFVWVIAAGLAPVEGILLGVNVVSAVRAQSPQATAEPIPPGAREVPSRTIPVPETVSPQMRAVIARPFNPSYNLAPQTPAEWRARVDKAALDVMAGLPQIREALGVTVRPTVIAGVKAFIVTPRTIPPPNRNRVLLHLHGGVRVLNPGEAGTREAILMAGFGNFKMISVDIACRPIFPSRRRSMTPSRCIASC